MTTETSLFHEVVMTAFNVTCLESQRVPGGRGCESYWQHIARCRELCLVHELLPPPQTG